MYGVSVVVRKKVVKVEGTVVSEKGWAETWQLLSFWNFRTRNMTAS
jgi:hypothetical protein